LKTLSCRFSAWNRYRDALSLVFRKAVENHVLTVNPAALVKAKPEHNERTRFLSTPEEVRLLTALSKKWPQHVQAFLKSIHTGMRASEQFQPLNAIALQALQERKLAQQDAV
jgi:hypothetical protein